MQDNLIGRAELSRALGVHEHELIETLVALQALSFPDSIENRQEQWTILSLLNWVIA